MEEWDEKQDEGILKHGNDKTWNNGTMEECSRELPE